jgi:hypothetical protein
MEPAKFNNPNSPFYYLRKYKTTQRPRQCVKCRQNAYYWHDTWSWVCAAHLLDLVNIAEVAWSWGDYPDVWERTERLLQREAPPFTGAQNTHSQQEEDAVNGLKILDGLID